MTQPSNEARAREAVRTLNMPDCSECGGPWVEHTDENGDPRWYLAADCESYVGPTLRETLESQVAAALDGAEARRNAAWAEAMLEGIEDSGEFFAPGFRWLAERMGVKLE